MVMMMMMVILIPGVPCQKSVVCYCCLLLELILSALLPVIAMYIYSIIDVYVYDIYMYICVCYGSIFYALDVKNEIRMFS